MLSVFHSVGREGDVQRGVNSLPILVINKDLISRGLFRMPLYSNIQVWRRNLDENSLIDMVGGRKKL